MRFIAHRGNTIGPNRECENNPEYVDRALKQGLDVEVDIWHVGGNLSLGHDCGEYLVALDWLLLRSEWLWLHCKSIETLCKLSKFQELNVFFHDSDPVTLTSKTYLWTYPGELVTERSVDVMPELRNPLMIDEPVPYSESVYAVCTDYPLLLKNYSAL